MIDPSPNPNPVYTIDAHDRIVAVNAAWITFTRPRHSPATALQGLIGRSVWDLTPGEQVRQLWAVLYQRVRSAGAQVFVPMRVDTPQERRLIEIELRPLADRSIQHICERIWAEARPFVALLDPASPRDERTLRRCVWCCLVQVSVGAWEEIEAAQATLAISTGGTLPSLLSVACTTCKQSLLKTFPMAV